MAQPSFEEVVRSLPDAFSVIDRDWRIVYVNDALTQAVGRARCLRWGALPPGGACGARASDG